MALTHENLQSIEEAKRLKNLKAIHQFSLKLNQSTDLEEILTMTLDKILELLDVEGCCIFLPDEDDRLKLRAFRCAGKKRVSSIDENFEWPIEGILNCPIYGKDITRGYISLRKDEMEINIDEREMLETLSNFSGIAIRNALSYDKIQNNHFEMVMLLGKTIELKNPEINGHNQQVCMYAGLMARRMELSPEEIYEIQCAAYLHDIGFLKAPDGFFNSENFNKDGWFYAANLVIEGADFLASSPVMKRISRIIRYITEEYDGNGQPEGLKGEQIPLGSRIISIANEIDVLQRFTDIIGPNKALQLIKGKIGTKFDPKLVSLLERIINAKFNITADDLIHDITDNSIRELTQRELEILAQVAEGANNKEIAEKLYLSEKTVKTHITNILRKLAVSDRTKAAIMAIQQGWLNK